MIRKISVILAIVLALLAVSPVSFAATPLWKEAGEKIAPMEKEHDYYDTWDSGNEYAVFYWKLEG